MTKKITLINHKRTHYIKTASGKNWSTKKDNVTINNNIVSSSFYNNFIESIPFFNSRGSYSYTDDGYKISTISTISPDKNDKYIDEFDFFKLDEDRLLKNSGYREKDIYSNLDYFLREYHNGKLYIVFYSDDKSFMLDINNYKIVN